MLTIKVHSLRDAMKQEKKERKQKVDDGSAKKSTKKKGFFGNMLQGKRK